jgi:hypothetical protein
MPPSVPLVHNRALVRASVAHSPKNLVVKRDRSALLPDAGSARREHNSRGYFHLMICARHDPHHARVPPPLIRTIRCSTKYASKIRVRAVTGLFRFCNSGRRHDRSLFSCLFRSGKHLIGLTGWRQRGRRIKGAVWMLPLTPSFGINIDMPIRSWPQRLAGGAAGVCRCGPACVSVAGRAYG